MGKKIGVVLLLLGLLFPVRGMAQMSAAQISDMYNLMMNLDSIFLTTASEVNGIPIMYEKDKWVQVNMDVLPLIPVTYGGAIYPVPMWTNINFKVDVFKEKKLIPEITLGGGYWSFLPTMIASAMMGDAIKIDFSNWNVSGCVSKTTARNTRVHLGLQYSKFTGSIGGTMMDEMMAGMGDLGMDTTALIPTLSDDRLDLLFGIDYTFIPRRSAFFLIGYDFRRKEVFEKLGIKLGSWVFKLGMYPGNIVAIAPSIEWCLVF